MSMTLADALVEIGALSREQAQQEAQAAQADGSPLARRLLDSGSVTRRQLVQAHARRLGVPAFDFDEDAVDDSAVSLLDRDTALELAALPVGYQGDKVLVAAAQPTDELAEQLERRVGAKVQFALAAKKQIERAANQRAGVAAGGTAPRRADDLLTVLRQMVEIGASDLHLSAGLPPMVRVHGALEPLEGYSPLTGEAIEALVYSQLNQSQQGQFEERSELDTSISVEGLSRFRVNVFRQRDQVGAVMRVIPYEILSLEQLKVPESVSQFASLPRGFVLVTGPTGSGKSTTLAALIDSINREKPGHILTVEDPIEFIHPHRQSVVNQREVGKDTGSFAQALKSALRQDPDVILVGEMRDLETISIALTAAETGHLVFGTLHTQSAPQTVDRIIDVFPPSQQEQIRVQLAGTLKGVVTQQLLPVKGGGGRIAACEVMVGTSAVANLIREGKTHQIESSIQQGADHGMVTMDKSLAELVKHGKITEDVAMEKANNRQTVKQLLGRP